MDQGRDWTGCRSLSQDRFPSAKFCSIRIHLFCLQAYIVSGSRFFPMEAEDHFAGVIGNVEVHAGVLIVSTKTEYVRAIRSRCFRFGCWLTCPMRSNNRLLANSAHPQVVEMLIYGIGNLRRQPTASGYDDRDLRSEHFYKDTACASLIAGIVIRQNRDIRTTNQCQVVIAIERMLYDNNRILIVRIDMTLNERVGGKIGQVF